MFGGLLIALETGLGLKREHQRLLVRTCWVLFVTGHVMWVCGFLAAIGLASPFARASDVDKLLHAAEVNARISMQSEIRVQTRLFCQTSDEEVKASAMKRIDELREELWEISRIRLPDPQCLRGTAPPP